MVWLAMNPYISETEAKKLKRPVNPMPEDIEKTLKKRNLITAYKRRPAYQKNDYIGWITKAKTKVTRNKRVRQMLGELAIGSKYMKMDWKRS